MDRTRAHLSVARALAVLFTFAHADAGYAGPTPASVSGLGAYHISSWTVRDGAPPGAWVLAQTVDGALWLGSPTGLFRFDGVTFARVRPKNYESVLAGDTSALLPTADGGLWIGMRAGGAYFLKNGELKDVRAGLPANTVYQFAVDADQVLWAGTTGGLFRLQGQRWEPAAAESAFERSPVFAVHVDRKGTLWTATHSGVQFRGRGAEQFRRLEGAVTGIGYLAESPSGEIWFSGDPRLYSLTDIASQPELPPRAFDPEAGVGTVIAAHDGALWFVYAGDLGRIAEPDRLRHDANTDSGNRAIERLATSGNLSGEVIRTIFEDRDQNIWIATNGGLDQFRLPKLTRLGEPLVFEAALVESPEGSLFAAAMHGGLWRLDSPRKAIWQPGTRTTFSSLAADERGALWIGTGDGLFIRRGEEVSPVPLPPGFPISVIQAVAVDASGDPWVSIVRAGLFRLHAGQWTDRDGLDSLPQSAPSLIRFDERGRMWLGYRGNMLAMVENRRTFTFGQNEGLDVGDVQALLSEGERAWVGGSTGFARFENGQFFALRGKGNQRFEGTSGFVFARDGSLWINTATGVARIAAEELRLAITDKNHPVDFELLDHRDGLRGIATQMRPLPSVFRDRGGRIWFSTTQDLHWIDPDRVRRNARPPLPEIHSVESQGVQLPLRATLSLPVDTKQLQVSYGAVSLSIPDKVRFKYRLVGLNDGRWQDAGTRREAFFTNLPFGRYRFELAAANEDGVWSTKNAALNIEIPPAYYQTLWFRTVAIGAALIAVWLLYRMRVRQLAVRLRSRIQARTQERESIAREMHDTLLQSTQGLILAFEGLVRGMPADDQTRLKMERTLERADVILDEGRDRLLDLRSLDSEHHDLSRSLALVAEELSESISINLRTYITGDPRPLHRSVHVEAYRIGREAIANVFSHANAKLIEITLTFGDDRLLLRVRDDGRGIEPAVLAAGGRSRHWGFAGMRERAAQLGAALDIQSTPGNGTTIELSIPAAVAYADAPAGRTPWGRFRKWLRGKRKADAGDIE